ncbi:hypothetical protein GJAV_G00026830 [Gymnothorax javanicus]|nr:hypothetical protein GJAV_G00026830 [Gymnothorax javanicus]
MRTHGIKEERVRARKNQTFCAISLCNTGEVRFRAGGILGFRPWFFVLVETSWPFSELKYGMCSPAGPEKLSSD